MDLRYKHVEQTIALALGVKPDEMGALRGRLRYLRSHGVPALPTPGSGQQISYTPDHILELMLALELERLTMPPAVIASFVGDLVKKWKRRAKSDGDLLIMVWPSERIGRHHVEGISSFEFPGELPMARILAGMRNPPATFSVLNLSAIVAKVEHALAQVGEAAG